MSDLSKFRLGDVLVVDGLITAQQLSLALVEQKRSGRKLGRVLSDMGFASDEAIGGVISRQLNIPFIDLRKQELNPSLVRRLPEGHARRHRALVLDEHLGGVRVGFADATDIFAQDEVARVLKATIHPAVVTERSLLLAVDRIYQRQDQISGLANEVAADLAQALPTLSPLETGAGSDDAPIVRMMQSIFEAAVAQTVSDIHVEPQEKSVVIRFRIDGLLAVQSAYDPKIASAIVQRLKLMANLDIAEKRLPQDGRFQMHVGSTLLDVRISTLPTQHGESVVMRLLAQSTERLHLDAIDMPQAIVERMRVALMATSGLILVTGPTGSGKTTTLYAALAELNTTDTKIVTVEDPVEYRLPGLNQVQVHEKIDLSFARVLRSCLRQDPDVLMVGEMRDQETAEIGLRASLTGHLVLSTLHTNDAASAVMRLVDMGIPAYMVALGLRMVISQRLVRVLCELCSVPHEMALHEQAWIRSQLKSDEPLPVVYSGKGCSQCRNTGYRGRTGVFEMIEMTPELVHAAHGGDAAEFTRVANAQFAELSLRAHCLQLVLSRRTSVAEAMRVSNQT